VAPTSQLLSCWTILEKHSYWAELPIIFFAVACAEAASDGAAWAGAATISVPQAAAARAAPATAFFGVATERSREAADTGGLSVGRRWVDALWGRRGISAGRTPAPRPRGARRRLATSSRQTGRTDVRKERFYEFRRPDGGRPAGRP